MILLCSEDLRFVACGLEDALRDRGWNVRVEFGKDARPWVQKAPIERPSVRILCVPGTVDRELATKLRGALAPEPDADLHVLGIDDSTGLVQEIEAMAGMPRRRRRPLTTTVRLVHPTQIEQEARSARGWQAAAAAAVFVFGVAVTGGALVQDDAPIVSVAPASLSTTFTVANDEPSTTSNFDDPVLSAVAPHAYSTDDWDLDPIPEEEDEITILEDEPAPRPITRSTATRADAIGAPSLTEPTMGESIALDAAAMPAPVLEIASAIELPAGFLPVANMTVAPPSLPPGFMPVAGLSVTPGADPVSLDDLPAVITYDPFVRSYAGAPSDPALTLQDPFVSMSNVSAP